jgi:aspartate carbamoyltransferase catalytic subunit
VKHILSVKQFEDISLLKRLFIAADKLQATPACKYPQTLSGRTIATIFYEPSTRTRLSFEAAVQNLGGHIISSENAGEFSSAAKGEILEDTTRAINAFADGIIIRHPEPGSAERAAAVSKIPIINAGDGAHEHPTQALLDIYSIYREKGSLNKLKVGLVGDLLYGRTVHSLIPLLALYKAKFYLISPKNLTLPKTITAELHKKGIHYHEMSSWNNALKEVDVLYMTRVQRERFKNVEDYMKVKDNFILTLKDVQTMKPKAIILHPLPRVNEIAQDVDNDPRARYFAQVRNGLFMRMALLQSLYAKL